MKILALTTQDSLEDYRIITRNDRVYLQKDSQIFEINGFDQDYACYLPYNCQTTTLHSITPIDPLFWVLKDEYSEQWQPLDQISFEVPVSEAQLQHFYATMEMDDVFYKFKPEKALAWLERKRQVVYETLLEIDRRKYEQKSTSSAFSSTFSLGGVDTSTTKKEYKPNEQELRKQSIQIVCEYLTEHWRQKFLEHLEESSAVLESESRKRKSVEAMPEVAVTDWTNTMNEKSETTKPAPPKPSLKQRQLQKTNIKGMSSLTSFFGKKS